MLLVFGPRSTEYDFGPGHPLTPRRFGPGIDLLRSVGAVPGLAPEPAPDVELEWLHARRYIAAVRRLSLDPNGPAAGGIGHGGDDPPFAGMHDAGALVAGGSIRAMEAILRGDTDHAHHPGGGLHHAAADRASGFCIYNDPALAITRARQAGLRVLYVDLDVHHGDGVQALHLDDPGVLTFSIHESGRTLFPGTGEPSEIGAGAAAGTSINLPVPAGTGERGWLTAIRLVLPELAASFGPDVIVSQHGADSHAWDPLAHLELTTTAHGEAARLIDGLAHRHASGGWLATGGGGYDAYRVVPRTWALTWLAGAHLEVPSSTPAAWRDRWAGEAAAYGQAPLPARFVDQPNAGRPMNQHQVAADDRAIHLAGLVRRVLVPCLVREATDRGWWPATRHGSAGVHDGAAVGSVDRAGTPTVIESVDAATWADLELAPRVIVPFDTGVAHAVVLAAIRDGATLVAAVVGATVVGVALSARGGPPEAGHDLLALGVAPAQRRRGLARALLGALPVDRLHAMDATVAERDVNEPLDHDLRASIAGRLAQTAGLGRVPVEDAVRAIDPLAVRAVRR